MNGLKELEKELEIVEKISNIQRELIEAYSVLSPDAPKSIRNVGRLYEKLGRVNDKYIEFLREKLRKRKVKK